jgi:hypothetical protein
MSTEVDTFESVKANLQNSKKVGATKVDLFSHVTEIINRILAHHKYDAYQKFEEISLLIKKTQLDVPNPKNSEEIKNIEESQVKKELDNYVKNLRNLLSEKLDIAAHDRNLINKKPE